MARARRGHHRAGALPFAAVFEDHAAHVVTGESDFEGCDDPGNGHDDFVSWWGTDGGERFHQVPDQVDRIWVLDVNGQTVVVDAYAPDVSAADRQELEQVVESVRFVEA